MKPTDLALPLFYADGSVTPLSSLLITDHTLIVFMRHLA